MSETTDWKQKYRESLLELQSEEKRWREIEQVLRRLIGRLCAAGMGANSQLDEELTAVAAANRRNADATALEHLAESLTTTVKTIDGAAPGLRAVAPLRVVAPPPLVAPAPLVAPPRPSTAMALRWDSTCAALAVLLERLKAGTADTSIIHTLMTGLADAQTDDALAVIVVRVADLIHERGESLAGERLRAAAVLSEVTQRLEEMSTYLTESNSASRSHFDDTQSLNDTVMSHVRELTDEVSGATQLGLLQSAVSARLESVARQVCDFRAREENRLLEYNGRAEHMRARIADLERETQDLHSRLDREKHGARLDPLTGVANRKCFDERFEQEIRLHARGGTPVGLLLWDIDGFKIINDSYGHRAGDRVLRSVAGCLRSALRATDFVARIGGEEFAVFLQGLKLAEAVNVANQVRSAVQALRFHFRGTPVHVTISCGITALQIDDGPETAFDRADSALYRAKNGGKNLCVAA